MRAIVIGAPGLGLLLVCAAATARGEEVTQAELDQVKAELEELRRQVAAVPGADAGAPTLAQSFSAFNPSLTLFGNFVGRIDDKTARNEDGDPIDDRFDLRRMEVDFRAAVDPWADGVLILTLEAETPGDYTTSVEEGYVTLKRLPILESAPLGLRTTVGRFRPEFGRFNRIHTHDLPQVTRARSFQTFLGEEGFSQNGVMGEVLLPTPGENNALSASAAIINGGDMPLTEDNGGEDLAFNGHLKWFFDLLPGHDVEVGASGYRGRADAAGSLDTYLLGSDVTYRWKPYLEGEWRSLLVGGEAFYAKTEVAGATDSTPFGGFAWAQAQCTRNLYFGVRYDFTEELANDRLESDTYGAFLTYYTTEFLRFRFGYERSESDVVERDHLDTFYFELNFVFGSHPAEPYWVNR